MEKLSNPPWIEGKYFSAIQYLGERSSQEDYSQFRLFPSDDGLLSVLADGMGGHTSGEIASTAAVQAFDRIFKSFSGASPTSKLGASLTGANSELSLMIANNPSLDGMGCTLIGAYFNQKGLYWISVGDSLIYLFREGRLKQINEDHSMAPLIEESLRLGKLTKQEAENYPSKNALRSALMGGDIPLIDAPETPLELYAGDVVLIASDGILSLSTNEILSLIAKNFTNGAEGISNSLIKSIKEKNKKNQDNTTIQVIKIPDSFSPKPNRKFKFIAYLLSALAIVLLSGGVLYSKQLRSWFTLPFNVKTEVTQEIKPVPVNNNEEDKKNDQQPLDKNNRSGIGGGLEHSNEKKTDKNKLNSKKNKDDDKKKTVTPKSGDGQKDSEGAGEKLDVNKEKEAPGKSSKDELQKT
jgi:serine/threonine protein phosphatase PrpC